MKYDIGKFLSLLTQRPFYSAESLRSPIPDLSSISRFCFVVSFFDLLVWFVVACLEDFRNASAAAFGPNDVTGDEKRRDTESHKTPEGEHLPIQMIGLVWARVAHAFTLGRKRPGILCLSTGSRNQIHS